MGKSTIFVILKNLFTQKIYLNNLIRLIILCLISLQSPANHSDKNLFLNNTKNLFLQKGYFISNVFDSNSLTETDEINLSPSIDNSEAINNKLTTEEYAKGGFSDGGGNAVDKLFFDFYENKGSFEIKVDEWIQLDPEFEDLLNKIDTAIPALRSFNGNSLSKQMIESVQSKKIFLESKKIESIGCKNQSLVATNNQVIVGCQSDTTIRMNLTWLLETENKNRLGLFLHELILSWARKYKSQLSKTSLEEQVRIFVRTVFDLEAKNTIESELANQFFKIFNVRAYSVKTLEATKLIKEKSKIAQKNICENTPIDLPELFQLDYQDQFLSIEIPLFIRNILSENEDFKLDSKNPEYLKHHKEYCEDFYLDSRSALDPPKVEFLNETCIQHLDKVIKDMILTNKKQITYLQNKEITEDEFLVLKSMKTDLVKITANLCSGLKGIQLENQIFMTQKKGKELMEKTYIESIHYIRHHLHRKGLELRFESN